MRYAVDIDQVTLHAFPPVDRRRLRRAFTEELTQLIVRGGLIAKAAEVREVRAHDIRVSVVDARAIGRGVARSVHGALKR